MKRKKTAPPPTFEEWLRSMRKRRGLPAYLEQMVRMATAGWTIDAESIYKGVLGHTKSVELAIEARDAAIRPRADYDKFFGNTMVEREDNREVQLPLFSDASY